MQIERVSQEFAKDLISLINGCKGITYNAKVDYVSKKTGQRLKFEYVTLDKIYAHVKNDDNFAILEPLGTNPEGKPALQVVLIHKSGEAITSDYYILRVAEKASSQEEGAAITYMKRYALGSFLGLCTDEDIDNGESENEAEKPKRPARERLIEKLAQKGIDASEYAKEKGLSNKTTPETFEKLIAELGD